MSHPDSVVEIPSGFKTFGFTSNCPNAAFFKEESKIYGVQFNPEIDSPNILHIFLFNIACAHGCFVQNKRAQAHNWQPARFMRCFGGVDSVVTAALIYRAVGDLLTCVFELGLLKASL